MRWVALVSLLGLGAAASCKVDVPDYVKGCPEGWVVHEDGRQCIPPNGGRGGSDASNGGHAGVLGGAGGTDGGSSMGGDGGGGTSPACVGGDERLDESSSCGLNGRGRTVQICVRGDWEDNECRDPDECEDGARENVSCDSDLWRWDRCVEGAWREGVCLPRGIVRVDLTSLGEAYNSHEVYDPTISADGRFVAFEAKPQGAYNGSDVFLFDAMTQQVSLVSRTPGGIAGDGNSQDASISADGRRIVFSTIATNLISNEDRHTVFVLYTRQSGVMERADAPESGVTGEYINTFAPAISGNGQVVAFGGTGYTTDIDNGNSEIYVRDLATDEISIASVSSAGIRQNDSAGEPALSWDGRYVSFRSAATNLVDNDVNGLIDVFLHDRTTGETRRVSETTTGAGLDAGFVPAHRLSLDGSFVIFSSEASNLVTDHTDSDGNVFLRRMDPYSMIQVDVTGSGVLANGASSAASVSQDGRFALFSSQAPNLSVGDTEGRSQVYLRDTVSGSTTLLSKDSFGRPESGYAGDIADYGGYVVFTSDATGLTPLDDDDMGLRDLYWLAL